MKMNPEQKEWIDNASYREMLYKRRFEPIGSEWFFGECGSYFFKIEAEKRKQISDAEYVLISKSIGWERSPQ